MAACFLLQVYDAAEYLDLVAKYEKLNWRIISKPGGATVKPDDFYILYGSASHQLKMHAAVTQLPNTVARPGSHA